VAILVDLNQVCISNVMMQIKGHKNSELDENLIRHMVLNSLRSYRKQFRATYGELIICCDSDRYWRKTIFPFYKSHRKRDRDVSTLDWGLIFDALDKIRGELKEHFPYKVINVSGAEADDVIATLVPYLSEKGERILILSSDKDFGQLQKYVGVDQYSPILKKFIRIENPMLFTQEHILVGDRGDGIPNFLSSDNVFAVGERQKPISKKKLSQWVMSDPTDYCTTEMLRGYKRNQMLIDFDYIPFDLKESIILAFESALPGKRKDLLNYFITKRLQHLTEAINDF
jgi:5'-3' exonuclease